MNRGIVYRDGVRIGWKQEATFDMIGGEHIAYCPGEAWTGAMPVSFYGTVAALAMAWRGILPLHACAIEIEGKAVLIAGVAGAGKSTLTAGLIGQGARFVADDLVAVSVGLHGEVAIARGRPTIRLHPDTVAGLDTIDAHPVPGDPRGKWLAWPKHRSRADYLPLGAVLLLEAAPHAANEHADLRRLLAHVFRRRWMAKLPVRDEIVKGVLAIGRAVPVLTYARGQDFDPAARGRRAEAVTTLIRTALSNGTSASAARRVARRDER